ncbi:MAG TPA: hypothetical protein VJU86_17405 [Pyrinomonadaceae bacterium]|nr:hypothetical protein [Pyrinomonadaceae bacterium]
MITPTHRLILLALFSLIALPGVVSAQTKAAATKSAPANQVAQTRSDLIAATETYKASAKEVIVFQEQEIASAEKKLEQLRQLVAEGLIARNELTAGEEALAAAKAKLESTRQQMADSDNLIAQIKAAEATEKKLAQTQALLAANSRRLLKPTSMRYTGMAGPFPTLVQCSRFSHPLLAAHCRSAPWAKAQPTMPCVGTIEILRTSVFILTARKEER